MNPVMLTKKLTLLAVVIASSISGFAIHHTSVSAQSSPTVKDVTLWDQQIGKGPSFETNNGVADLSNFGFNNKASAIQVNNNKKWRFYTEKNYKGQYIDIGPDEARGNLGQFDNKISSFKSLP